MKWQLQPLEEVLGLTLPHEHCKHHTQNVRRTPTAWSICLQVAYPGMPACLRRHGTARGCRSKLDLLEGWFANFGISFPGWLPPPPAAHACQHKCVGTTHAHARAGDEGACVLPCVCNSDTRALAYINAYRRQVFTHAIIILVWPAQLWFVWPTPPTVYGGHSHTPNRLAPTASRQPLDFRTWSWVGGGATSSLRIPLRTTSFRGLPHARRTALSTAHLYARWVLTAPPRWRSACKDWEPVYE